jgi:CRP-like cAMP-binding protein
MLGREALFDFQQKGDRMEKTFAPLASLSQCPLFAGIAEADWESLLTCLSARRRVYAKGAFILRAKQRTGAVGIVLGGRAHLLKEDFWGNRTLLAEVRAGGLFAEAYAFTGEALAVSVFAAEKTEALLLDCRRIIATCGSACAFHTALIGNMLRISVRKNMDLVDKIECLTKRTTRGKLLAFLSEQAKRAESNAFAIPFNRQELADYLAVDRSAMSTELSKMREAGILRCQKNRFELLTMPDEA